MPGPPPLKLTHTPTSSAVPNPFLGKAMLTPRTAQYWQVINFSIAVPCLGFQVWRGQTRPGHFRRRHRHRRILLTTAGGIGKSADAYGGHHHRRQ